MRIETSEQIDSIAAALVKAQAEIKPAAKDATNPHFKSRYADLASVVDACREALIANGLAVVQSASAEDEKVTVSTMLVHSSGQWIGGELAMKARDASPQSIGSAITYGRRYQLAAIVGVAPDDDDGESAQPKRNGNRQDQTKQSPKAAHLTDARIATAKAIAKADLVERDQNGFIVKSLDNKSTFNVWRNDAGRVCCDCEEFKAQSEANALFRCEHILAIKFHIEPPADHPVEVAQSPTGDRAATDAEMITAAGIRAIQSLARSRGVDAQEWSRKICDCDVAELSKAGAAKLEESLKMLVPRTDREQIKQTIKSKIRELVIAEHPKFIVFDAEGAKYNQAKFLAWLRATATAKWSIEVNPDTINSSDDLSDALLAEVPALLQAELDELIESRNQAAAASAGKEDAVF